MCVRQNEDLLTDRCLVHVHGYFFFINYAERWEWNDKNFQCYNEVLVDILNVEAL